MSAYAGFVEALRQVWGNHLPELDRLKIEREWLGAPGISNAIAALDSDTSLYFTGHSLGGALALLATLKSSRPPDVTYTFGCPRVVDAKFAQKIRD